MTTGTNVICTIRPMDARPVKVFKGTVIRVDPPEDGWGEGIVVEYPKVKFRGLPCAIFHEWPSLWVKEA
jgi:hypothetical protein